MNKPSERIVVFVSTAQKRAIAATAERLGISVSELMRRAVLSFGATSEQVKAASIVDRLRAPREPDALNEALQRVARATKHMRQNTPAALKSAPAAVQPDVVNAAEVQPASPPAADEFAAVFHRRDSGSAPLDPIAALAALTSADGAEADHAAQAAARVAAAKAAAIAAETSPSPAPAKTTTAALLKRGVPIVRREDDEPQIDPTEGKGRFA